jgi:2-polyprenyl-3-methyl-5-hydroxy-6-metoxy-1,4-benzoquinol methylase
MAGDIMFVESYNTNRVAFANFIKAYQEPIYLLPNDEQEQGRLDIQHRAFRITTDGPLYLAPISKDIKNVLDIGCGTGIVSSSASYPY